MSQTATKTPTPVSALVPQIESPEFKAAMRRILGKNADMAALAMTNLVRSGGIQMQQVEIESLKGAVIKAAILGLAMEPTLGQCWVVPYTKWAKRDGRYVSEGVYAQFQIGWRGYLKLAQNTGRIARLNVLPLVEGECTGLDEFGEPLVSFRFDREAKDPVGIYAAVQTTDGFKKSLYWPMETVRNHAEKYSEAYRKHQGPWVDQFEQMACKTVLTSLLRKAGLTALSTLGEAYTADQAVIHYDGEGRQSTRYIDNEKEEEPRIAPSEMLSEEDIKRIGAVVNGTVRDKDIVSARRIRAKEILNGLGYYDLHTTPRSDLDRILGALEVLDEEPTASPIEDRQMALEESDNGSGG